MEKRGTRKETGNVTTQSGKPGAGKGRRETVRGSGIYPASGPTVPREATVTSQGSMGRRHVSSTSSALVKQAKAQNVRGPKATLSEFEGTTGDIPPSDWESFLNNFSASHKGWTTKLRVFQPDQTSRMEASNLPLEGITARLTRPDATVSIFLGALSTDHITHTLEHVAHVSAINEDEVEIEAADRSRSVICCLTPQKQSG